MGTYEDRAPESVRTPPSRSWLPWRHRSAEPLWKSPYEQGDRGEPLGEWPTDGTAALVRFDRVEAYDAARGRPRWTWQPPDAEVVACAARGAEDGVGVLLHYDGDAAPERVRVCALDLGSGEVLWSREQDAKWLGSPSRPVVLELPHPYEKFGPLIAVACGALAVELVSRDEDPDKATCSTPPTAASWHTVGCPDSASGPVPPHPATVSPWSVRRSRTPTDCACSAGNDMNPRP